MQEQNTVAYSTCVFFAKLCCTVLSFEHWGRHNLKMAGRRPACSGTKREGLPVPAQSGRPKACLLRHKVAGRRPAPAGGRNKACSGTRATGTRQNLFPTLRLAHYFPKMPVGPKKHFAAACGHCGKPCWETCQSRATWPKTCPMRCKISTTP